MKHLRMILKYALRALLAGIIFCSCSVGAALRLLHYFGYCEWADARVVETHPAADGIPITVESAARLTPVLVAESTDTAHHYPTTVRFSPDGERLFSAGYVEFRDWSSTSRHCGSIWVMSLRDSQNDWRNQLSVFRTDNARDGIFDLDFDAQGRYLLIMRYRGTEVWDVRSLHRLYTLEEDRVNFGEAAFVLDDSLVAYNDDKHVALAQTSTGEFVRYLSEQADVEAFSAAANDLLAAIGRDGKLRVWDVNQNRVVLQFDIDASFRADLELLLSSDATLLAYVDSTGTYIRDIKQNKVVFQSDIVSDALEFDAVSSTFAVLGLDKLLLWNAKADTTITVPGHARIREGEIAFNHAGDLIAVGWRDSLELVDVRTGNILKSISNPDSGIRDLDFSPDDRFLAAALSNPGRVMIWAVG